MRFRLSFLIVILFSLKVFPQSTEKPDTLLIVDILSMVMEEKPEPASPVNSVLSFLTDAYSEHDFYDSGGWAKDSGYRSFRRRYVPFEGELPDYEISDFFPPVAGKITSPYGYRYRYNRFHHGIDVGVKKGTAVKAALPGVVTRVGYDRAGYGHFIIVAHSGDIETVYAHLSKTFAIPGQKVDAGDALGSAGSTGNSTGSHLHFETRYKGNPFNPSSWFQF